VPKMQAGSLCSLVISITVLVLSIILRNLDTKIEKLEENENSKEI
jgi:hypothetical protein